MRTTLLPAFGDGMVSSWHAPAMWRFAFGAGAPRWFFGCIYPVAPWGFCVLAGRPDAAPPGGAPDFIICGTCPAAKVGAMQAEAAALILEMAGPEPAPLAAPPVEEVVEQHSATAAAVLTEVAL